MPSCRCVSLLMTAVIVYDYPVRKRRMIRWMLVIFVAVIVFSSALPWLEKLGLGRLPGDLRFTLFGRKFSLPFASTILLSTVLFLLVRLL